MRWDLPEAKAHITLIPLSGGGYEVGVESTYGCWSWNSTHPDVVTLCLDDGEQVDVTVNSIDGDLCHVLKEMLSYLSLALHIIAGLDTTMLSRISDLEIDRHSAFVDDR